MLNKMILNYKIVPNKQTKFWSLAKAEVEVETMREKQIKVKLVLKAILL